MMEYRLATKYTTEFLFIEPQDLLLPCGPEQALDQLAFWQSRLDLAEPEARKRKLI
jgi:hypothetical protein